MKIKIPIIIISLLISNLAIAVDGMWLPFLLKTLNEQEMQEMGMQMSVEDIYSVNKGSLKDAIVHFGGFCTGEIISDQGLLLTNHHCGYGKIQAHSSVENNYLKDGFWAMNKSEELTNPGLFATFIVRMDDVTDMVLEGVDDKMDKKERQSIIDVNIDAVKAKVSKESYQDVMIRPFFKGNQYIVFVTVTYNDVRLVGAPPESIGKFGADTDNWEWPRHTGDFSMFRVYADKNNLPAEYSADNVPYQPKHHLKVSTDGVKADDFTLVFGFPGRTNSYLPASSLTQVVNTLNPAKIDIRDKALKIVGAEMRNDEKVKLQYSSKFARIANYWKKWMGESQGLIATHAIDKKLKYETDFQNAVKKKRKWRKKYGNLLGQLDQLNREIEPYALKRDYYNEIFYRNVELLKAANYLKRLESSLEENGEEGYNNYKGRLEGFFSGFYKDYEPRVDRQVFLSLMEMYYKKVGKTEIDLYLKGKGLAKKDFLMHLGQLFDNSLIKSSDKIASLFKENPDKALATLKADGFYAFAKNISAAYKPTGDKYNEKKAEFDDLMSKYMKAQMEVFSDRVFYPDANSTLRVTYGQVKGYEPRDAVIYNPSTYLKGIVEKFQPGDYEFDVPKKLLELYESKDFGPYGEDGKMPVCFLGTNHTTGGNSGSPVLDAYGNLIGLNFDRVWEGTMSDLNYDETICRNIMVDIRYILFVVDKFAGAGHLVDEMDLVHPKIKKKPKKIKMNYGPVRTKKAKARIMKTPER